MIVGVIHHAASDDEKPEFEIIRRDAFSEPPEDVRPCAHGKFILDEKWATVTCGKCNGRVDPFAALMHYATNYQKIQREHERLRATEKSLHTAELKRLASLRGATDEERAEIERLTGWASKADVEELRIAAHRIRRDIAERKRAKQSERRARK